MRETRREGVTSSREHQRIKLRRAKALCKGKTLTRKTSCTWTQTTCCILFCMTPRTTAISKSHNIFSKLIFQQAQSSITTSIISTPTIPIMATYSVQQFLSSSPTLRLISSLALLVETHRQTHRLVYWVSLLQMDPACHHRVQAIIPLTTRINLQSLT